MNEESKYKAIYIEDYGLSDYELGDAAMIKLYLMASSEGESSIDWDVDPEELIKNLKEKSMDFVKNDMKWENELHETYVNKWVNKRSATLNETDYSDGMVNFIEDVKKIAVGSGDRKFS